MGALTEKAQEILNYLRHITRYWNALFAGVDTSVLRDAVDHRSVELLETLAPGASHSDADQVREMMRSKRVFPTIAADAARSVILQNMLSMSCLIPSLFTFFENLKYLEPCAKALRGLLPPKQKRSILEALSACYVSPDQLHVEYSHHDIRAHVLASADCVRVLGYHQLWLFVLRNFVDPRKDPMKPKPQTAAFNPLLWQEFARLAVLLGFKTAAATQFASSDGEVQLAKQMLDRGGVVSSTEQDTVRVAEIIRSLTRRRVRAEAAELFSDKSIARERRCGRPYEADHENDRALLFLPCMHRQSVEQGPEITTLYCKWDMFRAFFDCEVSGHLDRDQ